MEQQTLHTTMAKQQRAAGAIILGDGGTVAMIRLRGSDLWLFPKGAVQGTDDEAAARRHIEESLGLSDLEYIDDLGEYARPSLSNPESKKVMHMFLFAAPPRSRFTTNYDTEAAAWVPHREVAERAGNSKDRAWYASVFARVQEAIRRD